MNHFHLVHGDINCIEKNDEYPNHSWVEKDGFVYDTTDGFKWEKNYIMNYLFVTLPLLLPHGSYEDHRRTCYPLHPCSPCEAVKPKRRTLWSGSRIQPVHVPCSAVRFSSCCRYRHPSNR